ncbi:MAG: IS110 family transposase [Firmicutes bacterium HGW-Firmicutes-1]|jgi:transposase|nr:MAG: IS110 family transposase [Firmicutes bacterium HGW-Firmicutes-1]
MRNSSLCIDVSKASSFATPFTSLNHTFDNTFCFDHSVSGFKKAQSVLFNLEVASGSKPDVVLETTGNYSKPLVTTFYNLGYNVVVLNPLQTSHIKSKSIRKIKTDPIDTLRIAKVYYTNDCSYYSPNSSALEELKTFSRQWVSLNHTYSELQLKYLSLLELVFPNFKKVFTKTCCPTALKLINDFPDPKLILMAPINHLLSILKESKHSDSWCRAKLDDLLNYSRECLAQDATSLCLKTYIRLLLDFQEGLHQARDHMVSYAQTLPEYHLLISIPGVGELTAITILSEIGDIKKFTNDKQLTAFAGLDASIFQSGSYNSSRNKISKRGTPYLRQALYQATCAAVSNRPKGRINPILAEYYLKKVS